MGVLLNFGEGQFIELPDPFGVNSDSKAARIGSWNHAGAGLCFSAQGKVCRRKRHFLPLSTNPEGRADSPKEMRPGACGDLRCVHYRSCAQAPAAAAFEGIGVGRVV